MIIVFLNHKFLCRNPASHISNEFSKLLRAYWRISIIAINFLLNKIASMNEVDQINSELDKLLNIFLTLSNFFILTYWIFIDIDRPKKLSNSWFERISQKIETFIFFLSQYLFSLICILRNRDFIFLSLFPLMRLYLNKYYPFQLFYFWTSSTVDEIFVELLNLRIVISILFSSF